MQNNMKEKLEERLNQLQNELVALLPEEDKDKGARIMENIISVRGQLAIEPTLVHVPTSYVIKEYDNDNIVIYRCKDCIIWRMKGGETKIVYPTMAGEYQFLSQMLDLKDKYDTLDKEMKDVYDGCYLGYTIINSLPSIITPRDKFFVEAVKWGMDFTANMYDEIIGTPLQEETYEENAAHEAKLQAIDTIFNKDENG